MVSLGSGHASGVNADGSVVVGFASTTSAEGTTSAEAFRWTASTGMIGLGLLPSAAFNFSAATATNSDGSVVVGYGSNSASVTSGYYEAFRWTAATGMDGFWFLPGGKYSVAQSTNSDCSIVVGFGVNSANNDEAFRWTAATGMVDLGFYRAPTPVARMPQTPTVRFWSGLVGSMQQAHRRISKLFAGRQAPGWLVLAFFLAATPVTRMA